VRHRGLGAALLLIFSFAVQPEAGAQESGARLGELSQIPPRIFVGDRGRLILSLGPDFKDVFPFVIDDPRQLPQGADLKLHRLEFERQRSGDWLLIDFTAFVPGQVELPPLGLPQIPGFSLEGRHVNIASILGDANPLNPRGLAGLPASPDFGDGILVLSNPAPPLAVPGTALLIYGTSALIVLALLLILGGSVWGRPYLVGLLEAQRRRRLVRLMGNIGRRLRERLPLGAHQDLLRELSMEFRAFLGYFYDRSRDGPGQAAPKTRDCRAMTAAEFLALPPLFAFGGEGALFPLPAPGPEAGREPGGADWMALISPRALGNFFYQLDRLRFSGLQPEPGEIAALLARLELMLKAMDRGFREQKPLVFKLSLNPWRRGLPPEAPNHPGFADPPSPAPASGKPVPGNPGPWL
jgi:hypothetical protein